MKISEFPEILGELSMRKQCVPGSFSSAHALEPGNEANIYTYTNASCNAVPLVWGLLRLTPLIVWVNLNEPR